jgi:hypothetical protein
MSGPWEAYRKPEVGPWTAYQQQPDPNNALESFGLGLARAGRDLIDGPAYLLPKGLEKAARALGLDDLAEWAGAEARGVSNINREAEADYQAATPGSVAAGAARVLGNVGAAFVPGTGQVKAAREVDRLWKAGGAANTAKSMGVAAGAGAGQSAVLNTKTDDDSLLTNAIMGAALAPTAQVAQAAGAKVVQGGRNLIAGKSGRQGRMLAKASQETDLKGLAKAIRAGNVELVPGSSPTTAQTVDNAGLSQLQRTAQSASHVPLADKLDAQNAARLTYLDSLAPGATNRTSIEAAEDAGRTLVDRMRPQYEATRAQVGGKFESIDPFGESRVDLPVQRVQNVLARRYGPGAGAPDADLASLVDDIAGLQAARPDARLRDADYLTYLRAMADEAGWAQVGGRVVRDGDVDARTGFQGGDVTGRTKWIPRADWWKGAPKQGGPEAYKSAVVKLTNGAPVDALDANERRALEFMLGEIEDNMPGLAARAAELNARTGVPVEVFQRLRSRATEMAHKSSLAGDKNKAAVAAEIRDILTDQIDSAATKSASGEPLGKGQFMSRDIADAWNDAIAARRAQGQRFETGPQTYLWQTGPDGLPQRQGAEAFSAFFNPGRSQAADMDALIRLIQGDAPVIDAFRQGAVADLAQRGQTAGGNLSLPKVGGWLDARDEAVARLFSQDQHDALGNLRNDLARAFQAENAGRATGSNTAQNLMSEGFLNSKLADYLSRGVPSIGPAGLEALRLGQKEQVMRELGEAMTDPEIAARAIDVFTRLLEPNAMQRGLSRVPMATVPATQSLIGEER